LNRLDALPVAGQKYQGKVRWLRAQLFQFSMLGFLGQELMNGDEDFGFTM
jgi:hypothetical protein